MKKIDMKKKTCKHVWQTHIISDSPASFGGGGSPTIIAICTKCLEKRYL